MKNEKSLLKEGTIRRFMKLAGTAPLAETFVDRFKPTPELEEERVEEEGLYGQRDDEEPMDLDVDEPLPAPEEGELTPEEGELDVEDELGAESPMAKVSDIVADAVMAALGDAVESGELEISEEGEAPEGEEAVMDLGEPEGELGGLEGELEEPEEELEELEEEKEELEERNEDVIEEIARRVARRLLGKK